MRHTSLALVSLLCLAVAACGTDKKAPPAAAGSGANAAASGAGELPPGHPPVGGLPEGHPPTGAGGATGGGMPGGMGAPAASGPVPLTWTVPEGWTATKPSSSMRLAQFKVAQAGGTPVECKVFGGILGGVDANVDRWVGQFKKADGSPITDEAKLAESKSNGLVITTLDVSGVFGGGMGATATGGGAETWRMLASVVEGVATPVQVQMVGPADVVAENAERFHAFVSSLTKLR
jgi:hypothetical protein